MAHPPMPWITIIILKITRIFTRKLCPFLFSLLIRQ